MTSTLTQQWLRQVAQPYPSKDRVYADVDAVLASYATLRPKTEVYTFNDGRTQLLICVHGLVPISYRGATYNIPVAIWITYGYQREPPLAYVVPTSDMFVRASKAVDPSGQCDIEYLRNWGRKSEGCSLIGLVQALQDQFSREPPVYAKPRTAPAAPAASTTTSVAPAVQPSRPPPPLPGSQSLPVTAVSTPTPPTRLDDRPALPAKPHSHSPSPSVSSPRHSSQPSLGTRPPPPIPSGSHGPQESVHAHEPPPPVPRPPRAEPSSRPNSAYASIPHARDVRPNGPFAPGPVGHPAPFAGPSTQPQPPYYTPGHVAPQTSGQSQQWQQPPVSPSGNSHWGNSPQSPPVYVSTRPASVHVSTFNHPVPPPPPSTQYAPQPVATIPPPAAAPIPDLLDDDAPGMVPSSIPAPPRPPNPELVRLHAAVHQKIHGELSALSAAANTDAERMRATQADLLAGEPAIRDEMARLEAVKDVCRTVASRLRDTVGHAEANVAELRRKGDPEVDELICSTTIVHNQLINLVAEDNAIEDTIYHLHRALNAGRIDLDKFLKTTRVLAEEQFTKRVLIERILAGLPAGTSHSWT